MERRSIREKAESVKEIQEIIQRYPAIGIASLHKVRSSQLQELRKKLQGSAHVRVLKNSLVERAIMDLSIPNAEKLKDYLKGSNVYLFTSLNPFKLELIIEKSKVKAFAKVGDVASEDAVVPAGNTGLPPGPIISQLNSVGIPTRIESGSVWVNRDTVVVRKGEVISESLAPILSKLGIKPVEMGLTIKAVYDNGAIISEEQLKLDIDEYKKSIGEAYTEALNLSLNAAVPMTENITVLIQIAASEAHNLAINASVISPETIVDLIRRAYCEASALSSKIPN
ncbi:MAG: 50S ribosomal protein L10 [Candidatus Bathyarchaeia archaeon]|nr:50S ribosomal protein L10 [Candidatus Bathyarchaeota archaeon]